MGLFATVVRSRGCIACTPPFPKGLLIQLHTQTARRFLATAGPLLLINFIRLYCQDGIFVSAPHHDGQRVAVLHGIHDISGFCDGFAINCNNDITIPQASATTRAKRFLGWENRIGLGTSPTSLIHYLGTPNLHGSRLTSCCLEKRHNFDWRHNCRVFSTLGHFVL